MHRREVKYVPRDLALQGEPTAAAACTSGIAHLQCSARVQRRQAEAAHSRRSTAGALRSDALLRGLVQCRESRVQGCR